MCTLLLLSVIIGPCVFQWNHNGLILKSPETYESELGKMGGEEVVLCAAVAFRGATGSQPLGVEESANTEISPMPTTNGRLRRRFRRGTWALSTTRSLSRYILSSNLSTTVDSRGVGYWVYWGLFTIHMTKIKWGDKISLRVSQLRR